MAKEPPAKDDLGWLALADRNVAEAVAAEQDTQHDVEPARAHRLRKAKGGKGQLALVEQRVAQAKAHVARQEAVVSKLVGNGRDTAKARELLHLMHQALDLAHRRRQLLLDRRARYLKEARERIVRQEQVIARLAANGHSTALAEKRLLRQRQTFDTMLERRKSEAQGSVPSIATPGQLGPAERDGHPGAEAP